MLIVVTSVMLGDIIQLAAQAHAHQYIGFNCMGDGYSMYMLRCVVRWQQISCCWYVTSEQLGLDEPYFTELLLPEAKLMSHLCGCWWCHTVHELDHCALKIWWATVH